MTSLVHRTALPSEPRQRAVANSHLPGWKWAAILAGLAGLAIAMRLFRLDESFDLFVDEITYLRLGQGLRAEAFPPMLYGEAFFLHPPLFFYMESAFMAVFGVGSGVFDAVSDMRVLNVALSGVTTVAICLIGKRVAGIWTGIAAALIYAVDPFTIKINSRVLLETAAMLFVTVGYLVLVTGVARNREITARASLTAGALFGFAILTKEVSAIVTIGPLLVIGVLGSSIPRRRAFTAVAAAALVYVPYPVLAAASGHWSVFLEDKQSGILRFAGSLQTTGFNRRGSTPFQSRITELVGSLGTTYVLLGIGIGATIVLLWKGTRAERILASWAAISYAYAGYSVVAGTLEEQLFYFTVVPAILVTAILVARIVQPRSTLRRQALAALGYPATAGWAGFPRPFRRARIGVAVSAILLFVASFGIWFSIHLEPDDSYSQLLDFMNQHIAPGAAVAVGATSETAEFVLSDAFLPVKATSIGELKRGNVEYVVLGTKSIEDGTVFSGIADDQTFVEAREQLTLLIEWLELNGQVIFTSGGRSTGTLLLYDVRSHLSSSS